jgi:hypothetical protein
VRNARPLALAAGLAISMSALSAGCGSNCCTVDSSPINLGRAPRGDGQPEGALLARAVVPGGVPFQMVIDTASPVTILAGNPGDSPTPRSMAFDLLDSTSTNPKTPVRASFRGIGAFNLPLGAQGDAGTSVGGVLGGDVLRSFSVDFRFGPTCAPSPVLTEGTPVGCAALTFWNHQGASNGFLSDAGYAVLRISLMGGGETGARTDPDSFGLSAPVALPPTRVVLRACAAPRAFAVTEPRELCCARGDEITRATGLDLSLVLATGAGPLVLTDAAWARVATILTARGEPPPPLSAGMALHMASWPTPIPARWSALPRFALVDLEAGTAADPGPCVELGRARRIEWVVNAQAAAAEAVMMSNGDTAACVQVCDTDRAEPDKAQNSAAYVELGGMIPVAVVTDTEPYLQALRADVRPEGPEVDGLVGAGALAGARLELDYRSEQVRAIFSCEPGTAASACHSAGRCPRLPDHDQRHVCFGLPPHGLPKTCAPSGC